ncbi:hypothetical protein M0R45_031610 [Rubus argutus]|uniref:Uncharacterized protein n=1 Tax=Rubus argutus TaxID=59490 RepID=A0AAW1WGC6_RUBAR
MVEDEATAVLENFCRLLNHRHQRSLHVGFVVVSVTVNLPKTILFGKQSQVSVVDRGTDDDLQRPGAWNGIFGSRYGIFRWKEVFLVKSLE